MYSYVSGDLKRLSRFFRVTWLFRASTPSQVFLLAAPSCSPQPQRKWRATRIFSPGKKLLLGPRQGYLKHLVKCWLGHHLVVSWRIFLKLKSVQKEVEKRSYKRKCHYFLNTVLRICTLKRNKMKVTLYKLTVLNNLDLFTVIFREVWN